MLAGNRLGQKCRTSWPRPEVDDAAALLESDSFDRFMHTFGFQFSVFGAEMLNL